MCDFQFWLKTIFHEGCYWECHAWKIPYFSMGCAGWLSLSGWLGQQQARSPEILNLKLLCKCSSTSPVFCKTFCFSLCSHTTKSKRKSFKKQKMFFHVQKLRRLFLCNSKIPMWDIGLLKPQWVCLGQTWSDCAWLTKPSKGYEYKQMILLPYFFNMFIWVRLRTLNGSYLYWGWISASPLFFLA